ncbi:MAG: FkbM family methyltransferase [Coleofasciculus sp. D1-CHI-01]|uniref:FkbM family methyltransferase n=1 Tax=Coleofasciculus sp. D1-CHI-01 TaxID=3068482 RepID=UPI0032F40824
MNKLIDAIHWKIKQKYSQLRCYLGRGYYIWEIEDKIWFISRKGNAFSHVLYVCKGHEKIEMKWCRSWIEVGGSDQSIIDCGANIGYFSAVLAQACSLNHILAVEGNEATAQLCQENFDILGIKNVTLVKAVLAASSNENYFIPDKPGREPWQQAIKVDHLSNRVHTTTLDELVKQYKLKPSLIKIDCEGFETFIIKGSTSLLGCIRPAFMIECNDKALMSSGTSRSELFKLMLNFNYKLFYLESFDSIKSRLGSKIDENFRSCEFNFAAIPNDNLNLEKWQKTLVLLRK